MIGLCHSFILGKHEQLRHEIANGGAQCVIVFVGSSSLSL